MPELRSRAETRHDSARDWGKEALCVQTDPEAFFPKKGEPTTTVERICSRCTVQAECLDYALSNDERFGIWGGLTDVGRRKLKRRSG